MITHEPTRRTPFVSIEDDLAERGLSIRAAAREAKIHDGSLRRLLAGEGVRPSTAKKVADLLGITVRELLSSVAERTGTRG